MLYSDRLNLFQGKASCGDADEHVCVVRRRFFCPSSCALCQAAHNPIRLWLCFSLCSILTSSMFRLSAGLVFHCVQQQYCVKWNSWSVWRFNVLSQSHACHTCLFWEMICPPPLLCIVGSHHCVSRAFCEAAGLQSTTFEVICCRTHRAGAFGSHPGPGSFAMYPSFIYVCASPFLTVSSQFLELLQTSS